MNNTTNTQSAQPAAHTPGPRILQTDENDIFVEVVDSPTEGTVLATFTADEFGYANARLIAAAPELLAALRGLEDMASSVPEFTNLPASPPSALWVHCLKCAAPCMLAMSPCEHGLGVGIPAR